MGSDNTVHELTESRLRTTAHCNASLDPSILRKLVDGLVVLLHPLDVLRERLLVRAVADGLERRHDLLRRLALADGRRERPDLERVERDRRERHLADAYRGDAELGRSRDDVALGHSVRGQRYLHLAPSDRILVDVSGAFSVLRRR